MTTLYYRVDGQRLAQARRDAFLTQERLAEKSGISLATIQAIEQPRRTKRYTAGQRPFTVVALATVLGIPPRNLLCTPLGNSVGTADAKSTSSGGESSAE